MSPFWFYIFSLSIVSNLIIADQIATSDNEFEKENLFAKEDTNPNSDSSQCTSDYCDHHRSIDRKIDTRFDCDLLESINAFKQKRLREPIPLLDRDPYAEETDIDQDRYRRSVIDNPKINCGLRYTDSKKDEYVLRTFPNEYETSNNGFLVTHFGRCGSCSSLQDLSVYLALNTNLTILARQCAFFTFVSDRLSAFCFRRLGFTESCAQIWMYNAKNTKRHCWWTCLKSWITSEPNNAPSGDKKAVTDKESDKTESDIATDKKNDTAKLNKCLQCDEDYSGLYFKYYAGRTRRNSGIVSAIERPSDEIRKIKHCYY